MVYALLLLGLVVLVVGAEIIVRGAVSLAEIARVSPLVIGLTVVAFGTSAPELAVSTVSGLKGDSAIALGNVVGSNIFNVLLILGLSAVIVPLSVSAQLIRLDVPIMIIVSIAAWLAAVDGTIQRWEGVGMLLVFLTYTGWLVREGRRQVPDQSSETSESVSPRGMSVVVSLLQLAIGLGLLVWGAQLLVESATTIARSLGVSDIVIGLTIVAAGTSLPELATSVVAAFKGQRDIAVGNVVGSNVFNLLMVLATAAIVSNNGVPVAAETLRFDMVVMVSTALLCLPIFFSGAIVSRTEGAVMLTLFVSYTALLISGSLLMPWAGTAKSWFAYGVFPATCVAFGILGWLTRNRGDVDPVGQDHQ
ncbi:calcium/sodium antiporter [Stieleria varia]|uniref:Inner membrane protein YrbG n=1 Tax=Stieleria varia TaxID=2528005 RepID=A0A5C5ZY72_9BACT|nr:calcium/sodium antiporter [Stieleria varia]TWT91253.1 Inner membrane protein YrbG [Stieleria varia]